MNIGSRNCASFLRFPQDVLLSFDTTINLPTDCDGVLHRRRDLENFRERVADHMLHIVRKFQIPHYGYVAILHLDNICNPLAVDAIQHANHGLTT